MLLLFLDDDDDDLVCFHNNVKKKRTERSKIEFDSDPTDDYLFSFVGSSRLCHGGRRETPSFFQL